VVGDRRAGGDSRQYVQSVPLVSLDRERYRALRHVVGVEDADQVVDLMGPEAGRSTLERRQRIARRGTEHGSGLGRVRWVVEGTFAWLHNFRRLRIRWERDAGLHYALLSLGCSLICERHILP
jgi:Transposase DDE domain